MPEDSQSEELDDPNILKSDTAVFTCPACGKIDQDEVIFLCNHCDSGELVYKEGMYMCPACLKPGENFECRGCGSKKVKLTFKK